jgi:hypothetical protein
MTEDEAKKTRCCGPEGCGGNALDAHSGTTGRHCIGSVCMAWRWTRPDWTPPITGEVQLPGVMRWYVNGREVGPPPSDTEGHCGLAGKP